MNSENLRLVTVDELQDIIKKLPDPNSSPAILMDMNTGGSSPFMIRFWKVETPGGKVWALDLNPKPNKS